MGKARVLGKIKLVASDLDGTLLLNWDKNGIDPVLFDQVRELKRRGVYFLAASGRQYYNLRNLFAPVADDILYLCENGSLVMKDDEVLVKASMPADVALEACRAVMANPRLSLLVSGVHTNYAFASEPGFIDHLRNFVGTRTTPIESLEDIPEDMIKVSFYAKDPADLDAAVPAFEERFGDALKVVTSGASWFDMMPKGVDKGTAMAAIGREVGIDAADMLAFGDNFNDAEMLDFVGHPYLMESGRRELRGLNDRIELCSTVVGCLNDLMNNSEVF